MKTFLAIVRWFLGFLLSFLLMVIVLVTIPLSIAGRELFTKDSGMAWLAAFTSDKTAVANAIDGVLEAASTSKQIEDPMIQETIKLAANKNSPLGISVRKILNPESVGQNLMTNASAFYAWLDGDTEKLEWTYKIGGTTADQIALVSSIIKVRYDGLEACTAAQRKEFGKIDASTILQAPCSTGAISQSTIDSAAKKMLTDPEAKKVLAKGIVSDAKVTSEQRVSVLALKRMLSSGILMTWVAIVIISLFMIILFTPQGVNFLATGILVGGIGLLLGGIGQGLGRVVTVLDSSLGRPIAAQGMYIALVGLALACIGIWQLLQKKEPISETKEIPAPQAVGKKMAKV